MIHAFLNFLADVPMARKAVSDIGVHLRRVFERT